jgi:hypothetical protein
MRYMVIVKASEASERGELPTTQQLAEMGAFNEQLVKAGVMLAGDGLAPSSEGARLRYDENGTATGIDGPFAESKELIGGFSVMELSGVDEVIALCRPYAAILGGTLEIDVRELDTSEG